MLNIRINSYPSIKSMRFRGKDPSEETLAERYERLKGKANHGDWDKKNESISLPQDLEPREDCPADKYYGRSPASSKPKFEIPQGDASLQDYFKRQRSF